jgi:multidrug resistance efflux pump
MKNFLRQAGSAIVVWVILIASTYTLNAQSFEQTDDANFPAQIQQVFANVNIPLARD